MGRLSHDADYLNRNLEGEDQGYQKEKRDIKRESKTQTSKKKQRESR
jgi:hypothetical protein